MLKLAITNIRLLTTESTTWHDGRLPWQSGAMQNPAFLLNNQMPRPDGLTDWRTDRLSIAEPLKIGGLFILIKYQSKEMWLKWGTHVCRCMYGVHIPHVGGAVIQWLALLLHGKKVPGSNLVAGWDLSILLLHVLPMSTVPQPTVWPGGDCWWPVIT